LEKGPKILGVTHPKVFGEKKKKNVSSRNDRSDCVEFFHQGPERRTNRSKKEGVGKVVKEVSVERATCPRVLGKRTK